MSVSLANPTEQGTATEAALLEVRKVAKRFGTIDVLKNISLNIASGEFLTLLGESGSGKTTLLRLIAGFEQPCRRSSSHGQDAGFRRLPALQAERRPAATRGSCPGSHQSPATSSPR